MVAEPPLAALLSECFKRCRYLHHPPRLLPAGATVAGRDSHPLRDGALPRRTMSVVYRSRDPRVSVRVSVTDRDRHGTATAMRIRVYRTDTRSLQQEADAGRRSKAPEVSRRARSAHACAHLQPAAWGVKTEAAPGGQDGRIGSIDVREIDAGEPGGGEPPRRLSGGHCGAECARQCRADCAGIGAVRGALMRSMVQRRVTRQRNGAATALTAEARSATPEASAAVRAEANAPAIGEVPGSKSGAGSAPSGARRRARREARARMGVASARMCARENGPRRRRLPRTTIRGSDDAARDALRTRRCSGGPGCRAAGPCRRGCR